MREVYAPSEIQKRLILFFNYNFAGCRDRERRPPNGFVTVARYTIIIIITVVRNSCTGTGQK